MTEISQTLDDVDSVMAASRGFVGIAARSIGPALDSGLTLPQFRALVTLSRYGTLSAGELGNELSMQLSGVTRLIDRLIAAGLAQRKISEQDRRQVDLRLTASGRHLVDEVMARRREELRKILENLSPEQRRVVVDGMRLFADAADDESRHAVLFGW